MGFKQVAAFVNWSILLSISC